MDEKDCISQYFCENISNNEQDEANDISLNDSQNSEDSLGLSQLTIEEQHPIKIAPFFNITPRTMPTSPHYVLEEDFSSNPWALLVITIFLTKTSGKTARPYIILFFEEYPTPYHVLEQTPCNLEKFFEYIGLKKRAHIIWKLSYQFVSAKWRRAGDLYGIGKYGEDAYRIFCLGHTDLDPGDRYLKLYLGWLSGHTDFLKENGVIDCECVLEEPVLKYYNLTLKDKLI